MVKNRIGIDVGGTNVKLALVTSEGKIIYSNSIPTRAEMGYEYTVDNIKQAISDLLKETSVNPKDIEGIGFGFPGQVDYKSGIVRLAPNIPGWVDVPIAKMIEDEFHIPTRVDNDVRCAALGELNFGAGKGCVNSNDSGCREVPHITGMSGYLLGGGPIGPRPGPPGPPGPRWPGPPKLPKR